MIRTLRRGTPPALFLLALGCGGEPDPDPSAADLALSSVTRVEQDAPAVSTFGVWYTNTTAAHSGGSAMLAIAATARATLSFSGTGVRWIGYRDEWSGIASVFLDGWFIRTVDTWASPAQAQAVLFAVSGLPSGDHTLAIEVLGTKNKVSGGAWIWVDAFDVSTGAPGTAPPAATAIRVEDSNPMIRYSSGWYSNAYAVHSGGTAALSNTAGATATLEFTGTGVRWIGYRDEWSGLARVWLDGNLSAFEDTYASPFSAQTPMFSVRGMPLGRHALTIEATHLRSDVSYARWVWVDAFDVIP